MPAEITPHLVKTFGVAARVQGQERYYAFLLSEQNKIKLIKRLDGEVVLAEQSYDWQFGMPYRMRIDVQGNQIQAWVNGNLLFSVDDSIRPLAGGGIALVCEDGRIGTDEVSVVPIMNQI